MAAAAGVVVLAGLAVGGWRAHWPAAVFGAANSKAPAAVAVARGVPAGAVHVVTDLSSRDLATVRGALAASYAGRVSAASLAPAGTRIQVQPGTWRQRGPAASVRAAVTVPGRAPVTEVVYLVREEGQWRILFTGAP